jgi:hypothetical protein
VGEWVRRGETPTHPPTHQDRCVLRLNFMKCMNKMAALVKLSPRLLLVEMQPALFYLLLPFTPRNKSIHCDVNKELIVLNINAATKDGLMKCFSFIGLRNYFWSKQLI